MREPTGDHLARATDAIAPHEIHLRLVGVHRGAVARGRPGGSGGSPATSELIEASREESYNCAGLEFLPCLPNTPDHKRSCLFTRAPASLGTRKAEARRAKSRARHRGWQSRSELGRRGTRQLTRILPHAVICRGRCPLRSGAVPGPPTPATASRARGLAKRPLRHASATAGGRRYAR